MKKLFIALGAVAALTASASAADLPARTYTKAPAAADPAYDWSGFYVGANVGGAWGTFGSRTTTDRPGLQSGDLAQAGHRDSKRGTASGRRSDRR